MSDKNILWWGRFDPDYSRNRIIRQALMDLGWRLIDFHPRLAWLGDLEAELRLKVKPDIVWVPCFRQRDVLSAARWARRRRIPLLFDPLISAYDKQVFERGKLKEDSAAARRLLSWERRRFAAADVLLADTGLHGEFFRDTLAVPEARIQVVPVGAEERLFHPERPTRQTSKPQSDVLFYGSFVPLQGPQSVIEAARLTQGEAIRWHLLGTGPLRRACETLAAGLDNVFFEDWIPYGDLPARIHQADILLGIFGATAKANRVVPNKVYQAMACGKPVITRSSAAYPLELAQATDSGISWVAADDPGSLAAAVRVLAGDPSAIERQGASAYRSYRKHFSTEVIRNQTACALHMLTGT